MNAVIKNNKPQPHVSPLFLHLKIETFEYYNLLKHEKNGKKCKNCKSFTSEENKKKLEA